MPEIGITFIITKEDEQTMKVEVHVLVSYSRQPSNSHRHETIELIQVEQAYY
jgi:hypothetical protein